MTIQYLCQEPRRKQAALGHATLNGIDYLEVLDQDAPAGSPRQRTLFVRCLKPLGSMLRQNVRIEGGVRIAPIAVEWVTIAADAATLFAEGAITEAERELFLGLPEPGHVLVVRTAQAGDFSSYRLLLVEATGNRPHPDFDPLLARVDFSFKVECPSEFDCKTDALCPPEPQATPPIDYLAKDYASFRRLLLDRLAVVMPQWQESSPADLGIALVEALAYAGDHLSYYQDAVATEAYLGSARRRPSVRRHARLLDYPMHDGCNARAWVCFEVNAGGDGLTLAGAGWHSDEAPATSPVRLLTRAPGESPRIAEERLDEVYSRHQPGTFELMSDVTLRVAHNGMMLHTWGDLECCLPRGATRATLAGRFDELQPGQVLVFEEVKGADTGAAADADPAHRHAVRLSAVTLSEDPLGGRFLDPPSDDPVSVTEIEWVAGDALPFPLCLSKTIAGTLVTDMSIARGNVALADHGRSIAAEPLPGSSADRGYRPQLGETGITQCGAYDPGQPASLAAQQDPRAALPAIRVTGDDDVLWLPRRDLLASERFDTDFVLETEEDGRARLRFGENVYGQIPPAGVERNATYRIGNGSAGNVGAEAIAHIVIDTSGITRVWNPLPAAGGAERESLDEVRLYAPQAFRTQERAVTAADYAAVSERHPDVQKAAATRRWTGSWYTVFLTVDRRGGRAVDAEFETELRGFLERYRLAGHDVEIDAPQFVALDLAMTVCVHPGYFRSQVKRALMDAFGNRDLPDGRRGFFHPDNFTFGQPVYLSRVIATAMQVPGVHWVDLDDTPPKPNRFRRWGRAPNHEIENGAIEMGTLEVARLDNDVNAQENGLIELFMEGGL